MKLIFSVVLVSILSGCVSHISWHGGLPSREYEIIFVDMERTPIQGGTFVCEGAQGSITEIIARELNDSADATNNNGVLILKHNSIEVHGSYKKLGPFTWDYQDVPLPDCEFYYRDEVVYSGKLLQVNGKTIEV